MLVVMTSNLGFVFFLVVLLFDCIEFGLGLQLRVAKMLE